MFRVDAKSMLALRPTNAISGQSMANVVDVEAAWNRPD